jgi:hypothetical protein
MCFSDPTVTCAHMSHALDRYVSELSYIHTKLMIVDDRRVIVRIPPFHSAQYHDDLFVLQMGSANFNDRSQRVRNASIWNRCLAHASTARATVTRRSLLSLRMKISFKVEWMGTPTERPASPGPCGANSSAVRFHRHTSRAYFPI